MTIEKAAALILLGVMSPTLLFVSLLIRTTAGRPILVTEPLTTGNHLIAHLYRFRTTGPGTPIFDLLSRLLRQHGLDELPILWNVIRGDVRLIVALRRCRRFIQ